MIALFFLVCSLGGIAPASLGGAALVFSRQLAASLNGASDREVGTWIAIGLAVLVGFSVLLNIINFFKPNPALHRQFADKDETDRRIAQVESDVKRLDTQIKESEFRILDAGEERAVKLHDRINLASQKVDTLSGEVSQLTIAARDAARAAHEAAISAARASAAIHA